MSFDFNKMSFEPVKPIKKGFKGRAAGGTYDSTISIKRIVRSKDSTNLHDMIAFRIGKNVCREARLVVGDRILPQFDFEAGWGLLVRVPDGGWAVSSGDGKKHPKGSMVTAVVKLSMTPAMFKNVMGSSVHLIPSVVEVNERGIAFSLKPKDAEDDLFA